MVVFCGIKENQVSYSGVLKVKSRILGLTKSLQARVSTALDFSIKFSASLGFTILLRTSTEGELGSLRTTVFFKIRFKTMRSF